VARTRGFSTTFAVAADPTFLTGAVVTASRYESAGSVVTASVGARVFGASFAPPVFVVTGTVIWCFPGTLNALYLGFVAN